jgi:hypothetical protein
VSTPDRLSYKAQCEREAAAKVTPEYRPAALPDHHSEIMAAHSGLPSIETQDRRNGAGIPALDKGPNPRGGA